MAPASGKHRTTSWPSSSGLCHYFMTHSRCKFGSSCKYSHDVSSGRRNGPHSSQRASTLTSSAEAIDSERHNFQAWRRLRPMPMYPEDDDTSKFFSMGLEITEVDASLAQEVVREMASDGRLRIIREVVERLSTSDTPGNKAILWQSRICPLFRTIIHPSIVDSVVVEQEMAIVYRSFLGVDATRLSRIYSFVLHLVDHWSEIPFAASDVPAMEALALSCGVLAKVIDTSTSNIVSDQFVSLAKEIQLRLDVFGNDNDTFHTIQASKYLDYVRRRLGIGQSLPEASRTATSTGAMAEFILDQDLPGALSRRGRRHDNDHSSIVDIKLMPTHQEIMSTRDEYLPTMNSSQHHLQGLPGLLDRHFRLLREDTLHELRNAVRASIETNDKVREVRTRIVVYDYAMAADVSFSQRTGLEFVVGFDQPRAAKDLDKLERAAWWTQHKRLTDGTLTCVIDEFGDVHFFQVSRSTVRTPRAPSQHNEDADEEDESRYSLPGDQQRAFVYLKLVDTGEDEVARALLWFKNRSSGKQQRLFEFPSVLLPAFTPPLKALQNMSQKLDLPFQDLLTLDNKSQPREITPPLYSLRPGFSFDLSCLSKDDTRLSYTPGGVMDPAAIQRHTTLDLTQSEAILASLSRSLALIQGPPGTGKSYTGEALIKVLLANKEKAKLGPIMCVCYTNHALDQLLEHLVDGGVQNIVRIGSRSKSERLEPVNLREVVSNMTRSRTEGRALWESIEELKSETEYVQTKLSTYRYLDTNKKIRAFLAEHHRSHHDELFGLDNEDSEDDEGWIEVRRKGRKNPLELWLRGGPASNAPTRSLRHLFRARLSQMAPNERVLLHQEWLRQVLQDDLEMLCEAYERYDESREKNRRIRSSIDLRCLQQANIIGITTTGLATNLDLLRRVKGKVLVCEEAGEVLESHLLTALLPTIEHAILIGDHLQLRPQIQDWRLQRANPAGVKYSLDVSLFERLVHPPIPGTPRLPFSVLNTQRRMHPSIAELIRSTLYPSLVDFESVEEYPDVPGLAKRLFWLHHETPESGRTSDKDSIDTSYSNDFEVEMVSALVSHLLRQGMYKAGDVAVLTPYLGQLSKLRHRLGSMMQIVVNDRDLNELADIGFAESSTEGTGKVGAHGAAKSSALQGVRVATVDNFQGEEARVVIVSLVRSNNERRCGFLSTSNRINVLLSRAKHGMFIIGNSHTSCHVPMWAQVIEILRQGGNIGNELELKCQRHERNRSMVSHPEHFIQFSPDGGCHLPCDKRLNCGHSCTGPCHSSFIHNAVKCLEDCARPKEDCDHPCRKRCGEPCDKLCKEILHGLGLRLPCGHTIDTIECWRSKDPSSIRCAVEEEKTVPGCGHTVKVACHVDVSAATYLCSAVCGAARDCRHSCNRRCSTCKTRRYGMIIEEEHGQCQQKCGRDYTACSHQCAAACHGRKDCPPCDAACQNQCVHSRCGKQCHEPCAPCAEETCSSSCPHSKCSMPCAAPCDWVPCTKRCTRTLACNHQCPSVCGETCPDKTYCQKCATDEIKSTVVDLIMFNDYRSVDLDEEPCIFPQCGHFLTYTTMDGQMRLGDVYDISPDGIPTAVKGDSHPFDLAKKVMVCPTCRGSLRNISRYGRIVRRGLLDESTKRFITWANSKWQELSVAFLSAQEKLQNTNKDSFVFPPDRRNGFDLRGARHEQIPALLGLTGHSRHKALRKVRSQTAHFLHQVKKDEQPYQRVAHLVWHINKKRKKDASFSFDESVVQMGSYLQAMALLLRCDLLLLSDFIDLCRSSKDPGAKSVTVEVASYLKDCEKLIQVAHTRNYVLQEVQGHIYIGMFCSFVKPPDETGIVAPDGQQQGLAEGNETQTPNQQAFHEEMKDLGLRHLDIARGLIEKHPSTAVLESECSAAHRMLNDGVFYSEVSNDEMRAVYQAMSREFSGTGHWYRCENGHPFTIGECGMAMQLARCPECGAPVGGQDHQSVAGVEHAHDIENLGTGVAGMRI